MTAPVTELVAPKANVVLVEGDILCVTRKIMELTQSFKLECKKVGILATDETVQFYPDGIVKCLGSRLNLAGIAQNLFRLLRELDPESVDVIIAESVPSEGLGLAVMNRLRKASGYNIIKV